MTVGRLLEILSKFPINLELWTQPSPGGKMYNVKMICRHQKSIELLLEEIE